MLMSNTFDQAKSNYSKNRGNPGQWFQHKADYCSPRPHARARPEGSKIANKNCPTMQTLIQSDQIKEDSGKPAVRLRSAGALTNAQKFNHQEDRWFDFEANQSYRPEQRKMKCYPQSVQTRAEEGNMHRQNDWYDHKSRPTEAYHTGKGHTPASREIMSHTHAAHADQWFDHRAYDPSTHQHRSPSHPRSKPQGEENALRSHGTASDWMVHHDVYDDHVDTGDNQECNPYRCSSPQAVDNWNKARGKSMANCFDYTTGYVSDRPAPRAKGAAEENLERGRGCLGPRAEGRPSNDTGSQPCTRTRPEAADIQQRNKGQMGNWLDQTKNVDYQSPRPVARVKSGPAEAAAERNKGKMDSVLFGTEYPTQAPTRKHQVRGIHSDAAQKNCSVNKGSSMKQLVENYRLPSEPPPKARVTSSGEEMATRNHGSVNQVFSQYGKGRPNTPPGLRIKPEASEFAEKHRGKGIFAVIQQKPPSVRS